LDKRRFNRLKAGNLWVQGLAACFFGKAYAKRHFIRFIKRHWQMRRRDPHPGMTRFNINPFTRRSPIGETIQNQEKDKHQRKYSDMIARLRAHRGLLAADFRRSELKFRSPPCNHYISDTEQSEIRAHIALARKKLG
jgi:hypothetical protein